MFSRARRSCRYDCVPRVTFAKEWPLFALECVSIKGIRFSDPKALDGLASAIEKVVATFEPSGTLYFLRDDTGGVAKYDAESSEAREILAARPKVKGLFVFEQHLCNDSYVAAMKGLPQ